MSRQRTHTPYGVCQKLEIKMKKTIVGLFAVLALSGCATTGVQNSDHVVTVHPPQVIYVSPHHWPHHRHWHWTYRHGWNWHHPRYHHHVQPLPAPPRNSVEPRRTVPAPVRPDRGEQLK